MTVERVETANADTVIRWAACWVELCTRLGVDFDATAFDVAAAAAIAFAEPVGVPE